MKKTILFCVLFICTFAMGCKKEAPLCVASPTADLMGKWVWVKRTGGFRGGTTYNIPRNNSQTIEFTATGTYKDCIEVPTCFEVPVQVTADSIFYNNQSVQAPERKKYWFSNDTLYINDGCCDRFLTGYIKY
jgi:hypothetical protein